jgi:hypothetical protein
MESFRLNTFFGVAAFGAFVVSVVSTLAVRANVGFQKARWIDLLQGQLVDVSKALRPIVVGTAIFAVVVSEVRCGDVR